LKREPNVFVRILSISFAFLPISGLHSAEPRKPSIVFVLADDLGCFELGCYGQTKIRTPNIDRMAKEGIRFTRFYSGNAVCAPSRCCLMTGKHPGHATIRDNREMVKGQEGQMPISETDATIADVLKKHGYATGAMGKWGLGPWGGSGDPMRHGFDLFYGYNCQRHAHTHYPTYLYRNGERFDLPGNDGKKGDSFTQDLFEKEALAFLDANKARPFFLYLPFTVPHVAVQVPEDSLKEYEGKLGDDPAYDGKKGYLPHPAPHAAYAAMVTRMDRTVGRILDKLKELKIDDNTIVMFTSDNGATHNVGGADSTFFESAGKLRGLKGSLYEGGIRVPMVVRWPGTVKPGSVNDQAFAFWDVLPTLCDLTGAPRPMGLDGIPFVDALMSKEQKPHDFLYWEFPGYGGQQAVQAGKWKLVRQKLGAKKAGNATLELFDLDTDPNEATDVAAKFPDIVKRLQEIAKREHTPSPTFPQPALD
jgi:arylsulfatase